MSVVSIKPAPGRSGEYGLINDSTTERRWVIVVSSKIGDDELSIRNYGQSTLGSDGQPLLPTPYLSEHPSMPSFICKKLRIEQDDESPLKWMATATYSTRPVSDLDVQVQQANTPVSREAQISWSASGYQKAIEQDKDGKAILNSAGDPFDPPIEIEQYRWVASVSKNMLTVPAWLLQYAGAVNSDSYVIDGLPVPAKASRITGLGISEWKTDKIATGVEYRYRTVTLRIEFRYELYTLKVLDQGFRRKDPNDSTKRIPIYEDGSVERPVTTPRLLDGSGNTLANPTTTNAQFLPFNVFRELPFNGVLPLI